MANGSATPANAASSLFGQRDPVFRPWPLPGREPANIAEFVQQLKTQGVEFRDLTEEDLRKEIAEREQRKKARAADGGAEEDDGDAGTDADDGAANGQRPKDLDAMMARRDDVLRTLEAALQSGLIAVDFVSLLLSKDRPTQAMQTLSQLLREKVGIGTLSAGRIANAAQAARALQLKNNSSGPGPRLTLDETTRFNAQRLVDHKTECVGWQLLAMEQTGALLTAARRRLHAELRREERYWAEVVAVRDRGWGLSRLPGQRRVLRVKFGFADAAPDLSAGGFAPLRRVKRGHVALDMSVLGAPAALVVTLRRRRGGTAAVATVATGRSRTPARLAQTAALEDRILEARNTIYAKELWRELNREARGMVAHGVTAGEADLTFPVDADTEAIVTLEPLRTTACGDHHGLNGEAEALAAALHLFLSHGHRQHYRLRSVPAPPTDNTGATQPTYFALRPVVANAKYEAAIAQLAAFLSALCAILHHVGHAGARFQLHERPLSASLAAAATDNQSPLKSSSEMLCIGFLEPREFTFDLDLAPALRLSIRSRTTVVPLKTQYLINLLPLPSPPPAEDDASPPSPPFHPLADRFPPADHYATLRDVVAYISGAAAHMLAMHARRVAQDWEAGPGGGGTPWATAVDGMAVHRRNDALWSVRLAVGPRGTAPAPDGNAVAADDMTGDEDDSGWDVDSPLQPLPPPELRLDASWPVPDEDEVAVHRTWTWTADGTTMTTADTGMETGTATGVGVGSGTPLLLQEVLVGCISGGLRPEVPEPVKIKQEGP